MKKTTLPPVEPAFVAERFRLRQDGAILRASTGEPATFRGPAGKLMVRVYVGGKTRRIAAGRIAWCLAVGELPRGPVKHRDGDHGNFAAGNLVLTKRGPRPFDQGRGGKASALRERTMAATTLLRTLADHPDVTVPMLSTLIGASESCTCVRLAKLEAGNLACSPKCDARRRWELSQAGRELAGAGGPVVDKVDKRILAALARSPMRQLQLARAVDVCSLTAKRRLGLLVSRGLVRVEGARFTISDAGLALLGDAAPKPWLRLEMVAASISKDVAERQRYSVSEMTLVRRNGRAAGTSPLMDRVGAKPHLA